MLVSNRIVKFTHLHRRDSTPELVAGVTVPLVLVVVVAGVCCYLRRRRALQVHTHSDRRAEYCTVLYCTVLYCTGAHRL